MTWPFRRLGRSRRSSSSSCPSPSSLSSFLSFFLLFPKIPPKDAPMRTIDHFFSLYNPSVKLVTLSSVLLSYYLFIYLLLPLTHPRPSTKERNCNNIKTVLGLGGKERELHYSVIYFYCHFCGASRCELINWTT